MKKFIALAVLTSFAAVPAMAESFSRDGVTYNYKVKAEGADTLIAGTNVNTGESFRLRVKDGKVTGRVGVWPISFSTQAPKVAALDSATVLASK